MHFAKKGVKATANPDLFVYLADSQKARVTWSGMSGRIPTLRCKNALMWHVSAHGSLARVNF